MGKSKNAEDHTQLDAGVAKGSNVTPIISGRKPRAVGADAVAPAIGEQGKSVAEPAVVVFGKDDGGKAHASWFGEADAELAIKAAGLMNFQVLKVTSPDIRAKALELPAGRIFESGKGLVPFCKIAAYDALKAFDGAYQPPTPVEPEPVPPLAVTGTPQTWEGIGPGSRVLASMGEDTGWFESVVVEARGDDLFVLRWQGWPDDPEFARRRDGLALLPAAQ